MDMDGMKVAEIASVVRIPQPQGAEIHIHARKYCGLLLAESGVLHYEHNGTSFRSDNEHALLVPCGISYILRCTEKSSSYVVNFRLTGDAPFSTFCSFDTAPSQKLMAQLARMTRIWTFHKGSWELACMGELYDILAQLNERNAHRYFPKHRYDQIAPSIEYLETHFDHPGIANEVLAEASGVSTVYFRKLFTEKYGVSPMRYVRQKRIERAQELMRNGCGSVSQVAADTGYASPYHFSKAFKLTTGITPTEFLRHLEEEG
ncbi:MAG: AraC family transcriptional regulator [Eubacteriales bacterium]|nr:AraC family transcriptional regulator [Eubacteriales bacterium]